MYLYPSLHLSCIHSIVNRASVNKGAPGSPPKASSPQSSALPGSALQLPAAVHSGRLVSLSQVVGPRHRFCGSLSIQGSMASLSESLKVFPSVPTKCPSGGNLALLQPPTLWVWGPVSFSSSFPLCSSYHFCMDLYIPSREGNGTHSSTLAWKIPWMEEPGRLQSMGSLRVRHD